MLKNDNDDQQDRTQERLHDPFKCRQIKDAGEKINDGHNADPGHHLHRPRASDDGYQLVDDKGHHQNIDTILPAKITENIKHDSLGWSSFRKGMKARASTSIFHVPLNVAQVISKKKIGGGPALFPFAGV